jgi:PAS domain-containing protein
MIKTIDFKTMLVGLIGSVIGGAFSLIVTVQVAQIGVTPALYEQIAAMQAIQNEQQTQIKNLEVYQRERIGQSTALIEYMPFPAWLKIVDPEGAPRMAYVNRAYEEIYGIPALSYIGKTDVEVWGDEIGKRFVANDFEVILSNRPLIKGERVQLSDGSYAIHLISKFPVRLADGTEVEGVGGISIPVDIMPGELRGLLLGVVEGATSN